jgi:hypothetical protein
LLCSEEKLRENEKQHRNVRWRGRDLMVRRRTRMHLKLSTGVVSDRNTCKGFPSLLVARLHNGVSLLSPPIPSPYHSLFPSFSSNSFVNIAGVFHTQMMMGSCTLLRELVQIHRALQILNAPSSKWSFGWNTFVLHSDMHYL